MGEVNVPIRKDVYDRIEEIVSESDEFSSVEEFVNYVLEEVLREEGGGEEEEGVYTAEEEEEIKKRLRDLGYL